jgi:hypothetical protein
MTVDLRGAAYAASRISSTLNGSTKQFGWLQAPATMGAARLNLKAPFLVLVTSRLVAIPFLVYFRRVVPVLQIGNNWEQIAINRQFDGNCGLAFCLWRRMRVNVRRYFDN